VSIEATNPPIAAGDDETPQITFQEHPAKAPVDPEEAENVAAEVTDDYVQETSEMSEHKHRHERSRLRRRMVKRDAEGINLTQFDHLSNVAHFEGAIEHGGNAGLNFSENDGGSSVSSFESGLLTCFQVKLKFYF